MLEYEPKNQLNKGNSKIRAVTRQHRNKRKRDAPEVSVSFEHGGVTEENFKQAKAASNSHLCGTLDDVPIHLLSIKKRNNKGTCEVCRVSTYWRCLECKIIQLCLWRAIKKGIYGSQVCYAVPQ